MTTKISKREAPVVPLNGGTEFNLTPEQVGLLRNGCLALRDFRHISVESMRAMHHNHRTLTKLIENEMSSDEETLSTAHNILYGPEAGQISQEEREKKRAELTQMNKEYRKKVFTTYLHTIEATQFAKALEDTEANFPKRDFQGIGQIDLLIAYFDLAAEGLIV